MRLQPPAQPHGGNTHQSRQAEGANGDRAHALAALPDVPTAAEQELPLVASSWFAVCSPNGLANDSVVRISSAIQQVVKSDDCKKQAEEQGAKVLFLGNTDPAKLAHSKRAMWGRIGKLAGIKANGARPQGPVIIHPQTLRLM